MAAMNLNQIVGLLKTERARIDFAIKALEGSVSSNNATGRRGKMSVAARARIAEAQRRRWAKIKAKGK
jgi:hypothetical protein